MCNNRAGFGEFEIYDLKGFRDSGILGIGATEDSMNEMSDPLDAVDFLLFRARRDRRGLVNRFHAGTAKIAKGFKAKKSFASVASLRGIGSDGVACSRAYGCRGRSRLQLVVQNRGIWKEVRTAKSS
jgi:hypothetical protein